MENSQDSEASLKAQVETLMEAVNEVTAQKDAGPRPPKGVL